MRQIIFLLVYLVSAPAAAQDAFVPGSLGVGRTPSVEAQVHVSRSRKQPDDHRTIQADMVAEGGLGGVWTAIVANAVGMPGWSSTGGQLFGLAADASTRVHGTGEIFGANIQAKLLRGATGGSEITVAEFDAISEEVPATRFGVFIASTPSSANPLLQNHQATGPDVALGFGSKFFGAQWKDGIRFLNVTGTQFPIAPGGVLFSATPSDTPVSIRTGIDLSHPLLSFTDAAAKFRGGVELHDAIGPAGKVRLDVGVVNGKACVVAVFATGTKPVVCED